VRELQNVLQRYLATQHLDAEIPLIPTTLSQRTHAVAESPTSPEGITLPDAVRAFEKQMIADALVKNQQHKINTARMLGIPRSTLHRKIKEYQIQKSE
jgi:DNA-binding NtrC family response regulator